MGKPKNSRYGPFTPFPDEKGALGPTTHAELNGGPRVDVDPLAALPKEGRAAILSMAPESPERIAMLQLIASLEKRYSAPPGGGGGGRGSDPPIPKHLLQTKQVLDFVKWALILVVSILTIGWVAHEYVSGFMTRAEHSQASLAIRGEIEHVSESVSANDDSISSLQVSGVRIELEQRITNDRLDQVLWVVQAGSRTERADAARANARIQSRIEARQRVISNPEALRQLAAAAAEDPINALDGL